mgnify:CR=1 FL=1
MNPIASLPLVRYRLTARLEHDLLLPPYAGFLLRSVFGVALRRTVCMTGLDRCGACPLQRTCAYPAVFEMPPQPTQFAQQFSQVPNPYIIEPPAPTAEPQVLPAGTPLVWHMVLVGAETLARLSLIRAAWAQALREGLGPWRCRVPGELLSMEPVDEGAGDRVSAGADCASGPITGITLHVHTPLRLQHQGQPLGPEQLDARTLLSQLLRLLALMQVGARQQQSFHPGGKRARNHLITIFRKLRAGQVESDIKHANPHITTALTGGWFYSSVVLSDVSSSSSARRPLPT